MAPPASGKRPAPASANKKPSKKVAKAPEVLKGPIDGYLSKATPSNHPEREISAASASTAQSGSAVKASTVAGRSDLGDHLGGFSDDSIDDASLSLAGDNLANPPFGGKTSSAGRTGRVSASVSASVSAASASASASASGSASRPVPATALGEFDDDGIDDDDLLAFSALPSASASAGSKVPATSAKSSVKQSVSGFSAAVYAQIGAAPAVLTFRWVLLYVIAAALLIWNELSGTDELEDFFDLASNPAAIVDTILAGMAPAALKYLDDCLAERSAWCVAHLLLLLHHRQLAQGKVGCYLILLDSGTWLTTYVGSCWRLNGGRMAIRIEHEHFNPAYRQKQKERGNSKWLYNAWDSTKHPVTANAAIISFLPLKSVCKSGPTLFLLTETALMALFSPPEQKQKFNDSYSLRRLLPRELLQVFGKFANVQPESAPSGVMQKALTKASSGHRMVRSVNCSAPLTEVHQRSDPHKVMSAMLGAGLARRLVRFQNTGRFSCPTNAFPLIATSETYKAMTDAGFTKTLNCCLFTLELQDVAHPDNWAQVQPTEGVDYELAPRLLLRATFVTKDDIVASVLWKASTLYRKPLHRACLIMSIYDLANGTLDLDADDLGPRRMDITQSPSTHSHGLQPKDWDEEETDKPFQCKECLSGFTTLDGIRRHLGLVKNKRNTHAQRCRESVKWGKKLLVSRDLTTELARRPGHQGPVCASTGHSKPWACRSCGKEFDKLKLDEHLSLKPNFRGQYRQSAATETCRAAYIANGFDMDPATAKLTKENSGLGLPRF